MVGLTLACPRRCATISQAGVRLRLGSKLARDHCVAIVTSLLSTQDAPSDSFYSLDPFVFALIDAIVDFKTKEASVTGLAHGPAR